MRRRWCVAGVQPSAKPAGMRRPAAGAHGASRPRHGGGARPRRPGSMPVSSARPPRCTTRASGCARCRCSTRSGSASCRSASSSGPRCCSTSARCTGPATAGSSGCSTSCWRWSALRGAASCPCRSWSLGDLVANRGPLLYRQARVGKNGEPFEISSSAPCDPADDETTHRVDRPTRSPDHAASAVSCGSPTSTSCPRCSTSSRATSRWWAPAPSSPTTSRSCRSKLPFYDLRHLVRPGLTGWAQVKYGYAGDESDAVEKLQYEFYYLRRQSIGLDLRIIGRTVRSRARARRPMSASATACSPRCWCRPATRRLRSTGASTTCWPRTCRSTASRWWWSTAVPRRHR